MELTLKRDSTYLRILHYQKASKILFPRNLACTLNREFPFFKNLQKRTRYLEFNSRSMRVGNFSGKTFEFIFNFLLLIFRVTNFRIFSQTRRGNQGKLIALNMEAVVRVEKQLR